MLQGLNDGRVKLQKLLLETDVRSRGPLQASAIGTARVIYAVVRDLTDGQLTLRAMSMVYTTLLSLVPLLALSFSVLKGFGVHNQIEPMLFNFVAPLGEQGEEIAHKIMQFVDNVNARALGSVGLVILMYTVVSLLQKVERGFNFIWRVGEARSFVQRFSDYLSVVMIGPVLLFTALGITASALNAEFVQRLTTVAVLGDAVVMLTKLVPYILVIFAFTFVYIFVPNTRVKVRTAFIGALVAGALWETSGWAFASFVASSTRNVAIYSGFAVLILFMMWLYLSWLILLIGASIAFYVQNPEYRLVPQESMRLGNRSSEHLALQIMYLVSRAFLQGQSGWSLDRLVESIGLPKLLISESVSVLMAKGLLLETSDKPAVYVPATDPQHMTVQHVLSAVRDEDDLPVSTGRGMAVDRPVAIMAERMDAQMEVMCSAVSLAELTELEDSAIQDR